jgi:hypothetical protein
VLRIFQTAGHLVRGIYIVLEQLLADDPVSWIQPRIPTSFKHGAAPAFSANVTK